MKILGVIPARYASSRLPGKPLEDIGGKSMIQRVFENARACQKLSKVLIATDSQKIHDHSLSFTEDVVLTSPDHTSGTERCREALQLSKDYFQALINIQGDEPFLAPEQIDHLASRFEDPETEIATLAHSFEEEEMAKDPHRVKVVLDQARNALYFSRSPIPYHRDQTKAPRYYEHVGIYGYLTEVLERIVTLPPSPLEQAEGLEQLRWMENGLKIKVGETDTPLWGVDTPEDLEKARERVRKKEASKGKED